jgi:hypothetical protein
LLRNIGTVTSHAKTHGQRNFAMKPFVLIHLSRLPKRPSPNQGQSYAKKVIFPNWRCRRVGEPENAQPEVPR